MTALIRIEALPGDGRYAVSFERLDGSEQTAVVHLVDSADIAVADASLPAGWSRDSEAFAATAAAIRAFDAARQHAPAGPSLRDVDGGWDVSLGNVVLGAAGEPRCSAHGEMTETDRGDYLCSECYARAVLVG
ncbi:MAG TPA: hypothetical protein VE442_08870 [Jatrophihabitans sp.]|jgi:hypothetical protein|nr:hypothetical protein [Jatrophihabitans sp.]